MEMNTSSSTTSNSSPSSISNDHEDGGPLWKYVKKLGKSGVGGGSVTWECNFCSMTKTTTYTRVRAHLLKIKNKGISGCREVTINDLEEMRKLEEEAKKIEKDCAARSVPLPPHTMSQGELYSSVHESKKRKDFGNSSSSQSLIEKAFNTQGRNQLHALIARFFYASGLPFHLARSPYYMSSYSFAASHNLSGYLPPSYNMLRTSLLQQEKANVERLLQPIKSTWKEKGISIVSDGWSDSQRRPLINFMAVTESGPMFLKAVDCSGEIKDIFFIFNLMKEVIEDVGAQNVVQVITDNARNCAGAGSLVEDVYPHIVWTPCVVHTLNLALQNICAAKNVENNQVVYDECSWISIISVDASMIKNFIMNHGMRLAIFNKFVPLKLLSFAPTRFASVIVMLKRFKLIKRCLINMVVSEEWSNYREDDIVKARCVKEFVLNDLWWDKIDYILSFTAPIYDMLRACDTDKPCLHLVYDMWDTMIEKVKLVIYGHEGKQSNEPSSFYNVVHEILVSRWNKNNTPLHCLAHSLNLRYYSDEWLSQDPSRIPPHRDNEVAKERIKCLKRYFPNEDERSMVTMEFANFSSMSGGFSEPGSIRDRAKADPKGWWCAYGASAPTLQKLACKLLVQPSSSSCAERNWSTYSFVHSVRRNKMTPKCAEDLVFIHSNLRLLSRKTPKYSQGASKLWDIAGDNFGTFEDVGELEVAQLSLDEPDLEGVVFTVDGDEAAGDDDGTNVMNV